MRKSWQDLLPPHLLLCITSAAATSDVVSSLFALHVAVVGYKLQLTATLVLAFATSAACTFCRLFSVGVGLA
jgi:hypothetical protein